MTIKRLILITIGCLLVEVGAIFGIVYICVRILNATY